MTDRSWPARILERRLLLLGLIAGFSILSHLRGITAPMLDYHYHRQCNTAAIARNYHENGMKFLRPQIDWEGDFRGRTATEFPIYMWLMGLLWPLGGLGAPWGRFLSVALSALTAVYLFIFLEDWIEKEAAFYAAILFSVIPLEIYFGRTVQPEAAALFSSLAALTHWHRSLKRRRSWLHFGLAAVFAFLAMSLKLPYLYLLMPLAFLSWHHLGRKSFSDSRTILAPLLAVGAVYAWYRYAGSGYYVVPTHLREITPILNYRNLPYYVQFAFLSRFPELAATWGGLVLFFFGLRELVFRRRSLFFGAWFVSVCIDIIASGGYAHYHEYTSLPFAPVNAAFMGLGLMILLKKARASRMRGRALAGLAALLLSMPAFAHYRISHWYKLTYPFLLHAREAADAVSTREDLFLCNERGGSVFLFHLNRRGWSWDLYEQGQSHLGWIEGKIRKGAKFYVTHKSPDFAEGTGVFARYFHSRYPVVYDKNGILIFRLRPGA